MGAVLSQTVPNQVISVPVGITEGVVLLSQVNPTFRGTDRDNCVIRGDGTVPYTTLFAYTTNVVSVTIENCTLDAAGLSALLGIISSGANCETLTITNCRIIGVRRDGICITNAAKLYIRGCIFQADATSIQSTLSSTVTSIIDCESWGGRSSFTLSAGTAGTVPGIRIINYRAYPHYSQSPTYESAIITSLTLTGVNVYSHVEAHRSFADCLRLLYAYRTFDGGGWSEGEPWDRVEVPDGRWGYFKMNRNFSGWHATGSWRPAAPPSGQTATVYRVITGRLYSYTSTLLSLQSGSFVPDPHWRRVDGSRVTLQEIQSATRLDILRHDISGLGIRDVDSGFHITSAGLNPYLEEVYVENGFSDMITSRATGTYATNCWTRIGQDFCFTCDAVTGPQTWVNCKAEKSGVAGFYCNGTLQILDATIINNGIHGDGLYGIGVAIVDGAVVTLSVKLAAGNRQNIDGVYSIPPQSTAKLPPESYMLRLRRMKEIQ